MHIHRVLALALIGLPSSGQNLAEKEAGLGRQMASEFRKSTHLIDSPAVQEYVDRLGQRIVSQLPREIFPFTFSVIADDPCPGTHEPVALPGGWIFVPASLFLAAQDEHEFAGMLAHAVIHVTQRHGASGKLTNSATLPLIFLGTAAGNGCSERMAVPLAFQKQQRINEVEADSLATATMSRAGFDPNALARYLQRNGIPPTPRRDRRIEAIMSAIQRLPAATYPPLNAGDFVAVQAEIRRLNKHSPA